MATTTEAKVPSITDRYLAALLAQPAVSTITLADETTVAVEDVYVSRTLLHEIVQKQEGREITVKFPVELWPKLKNERVVVVEGPAGIGKSTLTKQLVRESRAQHLIPIWIPFRPFVASCLSIVDYLDQQYVSWLGLAGLRVPYRDDGTGPDRSLGRWLYEQWESGFGGVLILDGLDEVFQYDERVTALQGLPITRTGATRPATILTSRPLSQSLPIQMAKVEVQGLTPSEQIKFIEGYRASLHLTNEQVTHFTSATKKQEQGRLRELLTRPGHLIQILTTYARTNTLLDTETAVVDELLRSRLTITGRSEPPVEPDEPEKKHLVLASLALHLLACRQGQRHTRAQLLTLIQQVLREHTTHGTPLFLLAQATALLNDLTRNSTLLIEVEPDRYEFETVIWLQHLTGMVLADQKAIASLNLTDTQVIDFLDKKAWDPEWEPVLMSWVGNSMNPFPLFERLTDKQQDDLARHRLGTGGRCVREVPAGHHDLAAAQQLGDQIAIEAFERWRVEAERGTEKLVKTSLRGAWVETVVGQDELLVLLANSTKSMCIPAIEVLSELKQTMPKTAQEALVGRLQVKSFVVRKAVAKGLGGVGSALSEIVQEALIGRLTDAHEVDDVQEAAAEVLGQLGATMSESIQNVLVAQLKGGKWAARKMAVEVLSGMGSAMPGSVQQALVESLQDKEVGVREAAVKALCSLGAAMSEPVQQMLVARLEDREGQVGEVQKTVSFSPSTNWCKEPMFAYESEKEADALLTMARALGGLGAAMAVSVRHILMARLTDYKWDMRRAAVTALGGLGTAMPASVMEALVTRLMDSDGKVREATVDALGRLGTAMSASVQQALVERLADSDVNVRVAAVFALGMQDVKLAASVQAALLVRLTDADWFVASVAGKSIGRIGTAMLEPVRETLVGLLTDSEEDVRTAAIQALRGLGSAMPETVQETLVASLRYEGEAVRQEVVEALGGLGLAMPIPVQQALVAQLELTNSSNYSFIGLVLGGLGRLERAMPKAVQQALVAMLTNEHPKVAGAAVRALGGLGSAMPESVQQALAVRLMDPEVGIRHAAGDAVYSAQQQGLRFFSHGAANSAGRLISGLSATTPFPDNCFRRTVRPRFFFIPF